MTKQVNKIYTFDNLSFGKVCSTNRTISKAHVNAIFNGLEAGQWHRLQELYVDIDTDEIVDGNHRFLALTKYLQKHGSLQGHTVNVIYYKRQEGQTLSDAIKEFNSGRKALTGADFIQLAKYDHNQAIEAMETFGLTHKLCVKKYKKDKEGNQIPVKYHFTVVEHFIGGRGLIDNVINGTLSVTQEQLAFAHTLHEECVKMLEATGITFRYTGSLRSLVIAWRTLRLDPLFSSIYNKHSIDEFTAQLVTDMTEAVRVTIPDYRSVDWTRLFSSVMSNLDSN